MTDTLFSKEFWIRAWEESKKEDAFNVHKGFSTPEFWDRAAATYDTNADEISSRSIDKTLALFERNQMDLNGIKILDIGCGTGLLAVTLAKQGARVTAVDFSSGMITECRKNIPDSLQGSIDLHQIDWNRIDLKKMGWKRRFDLVIAFMSPAVSSLESLTKMMDASASACAMKGWAAKRNHPILDALWKKIMGEPLEDKPLSLMIKYNLLFSMGFFPEIFFDDISWEKNITMEEELLKQLAFFKRLSKRPEKELRTIIRNHLESIVKDGFIVRRQGGKTGTLFWRIS